MGIFSDDSQSSPWVLYKVPLGASQSSPVGVAQEALPWEVPRVLQKTPLRMFHEAPLAYFVKLPYGSFPGEDF